MNIAVIVVKGTEDVHLDDGDVPNVLMIFARFVVEVVVVKQVVILQQLLQLHL